MNTESSINQSLYKTRAILSEQQKLKNKAKQLKLKLEQAKKKKELELEKCVREHMISYYQTEFQAFKLQLEEQAKSQSLSFQLIKEFKLNQINEFEEVVKQAIENMSRCRKETEQKQQELRKCYELSMKQLDNQMEKQKDLVKATLIQQKNAKIDEYKSNISIQ